MTPLRYFMPEHEHQKFLKLAGVLADKAGSQICSILGNGPPTTEHDRRVLRTAAVMIAEISSEELVRQCKFIVSKVLTKNETKTVSITMKLLVADLSATFANTMHDTGAQTATVTRVMKKALDVLTGFDDLYETGAWYQADDVFGKKKFYVHENYELKDELARLLKAIATYRKRMSETDAELAKNILLVANRVRKAISTSRATDHFTPLGDAELES